MDQIIINWLLAGAVEILRSPVDCYSRDFSASESTIYIMPGEGL